MFLKTIVTKFKVEITKMENLCKENGFLKWEHNIYQIKSFDDTENCALVFILDLFLLLLSFYFIQHLCFWKAYT